MRVTGHTRVNTATLTVLHSYAGALAGLVKEAPCDAMRSLASRNASATSVCVKPWQEVGRYTWGVAWGQCTTQQRREDPA